MENDIKILEKLISFNTIKDKENKKMIEYIYDYLQNLKVNVKIYEVNGKYLLYGYKGNPKICFMGHTDTVDISGNWNTSPFKLTIDNDKLYGLGTCDMKGGIAAYLASLRKIDLDKYGCEVLLTYDEELDFEGIINAQKLGLLNLKSDIIVLGEPTDNKIILATKGCQEYEVDFFGKSVHSSECESGVNAIDMCINFISELKCFSEKLKLEKNYLFSTPYTTCNIGLINGGTSANIVPNKCFLKFDFRVISNKQNSIIYKKVLELSSKYDCKFKRTIDINPLECNNDFMKYIKNVINMQPLAINYVTEASFIQNKNVIILGTGPNNAHKTNEYIIKVSYENLIKMYIKLIKQMKGEV